MTSVSVLNLNTMHGRNSKSAAWPLWTSRQKVEANFLRIINLIHRYNPDIVTLQEIDRASLMTDGLNQFDLLINKLDYPYKYFAPSCSITLFRKSIFLSGNAIFSKYPLINCESYDFFFTFPTERQGFVIADVQLPSGEASSIVSVHTAWLDWLRFNSRFRQLKLLERVVRESGKKTIIAGDMNCDVWGKEQSLRSFIKNLNLSVFDPENKSLNTHPSWLPVARIDWILASHGIRFTSHETIAEVVSDHLAVFAKLAL